MAAPHCRALADLLRAHRALAAVPDAIGDDGPQGRARIRSACAEARQLIADARARRESGCLYGHCTDCCAQPPKH